MSVTPRGASTSQLGNSSSNPGPKQAPISWADVEDDDDYGFLPVQRLGDHQTPSKDSVDTQPNTVSPSEIQQSESLTKTSTAVTKTSPATVVTKKIKKVTPGTSTSAAKKSPMTAIDSEAAKSFMRQEMLARNLFPSFVEVTVDGQVPYSLKSTAALSDQQPAAATDIDVLGGSSSVDEGSAGNSPTQVPASRRAFEAQGALPAAIAATANINVADRSHLGRRRRAIRVIADTLVSNGGKTMQVGEVARATKWNKTFRPGLGCLFSFIKSLPSFFVYHHGEISLTYEEDIASTMLRTWSETDPNAAELNSIAASHAAAVANEKLMKEKTREGKNKAE